MKPILRSESSDLEAARKIVSRTERRSLERAEALRAEAEQLLKLVSSQAVDAEVKVRAEFGEQIRALREEMAEASRRATVAENELELLRASSPARAGADHPRTEMVSTGGEGDRLSAAATATAAQIRAQAEIELARARKEAVALLAEAAREAGDLLFSAKVAIENDTTAAHAARQQAEEERQAAASIRSELQVVLGQCTDGGAVVRPAEATGRELENAQVEADRVVAAARREAAEALNAVRRQLLAEMLSMRDAMDRTRDSFTQFLDSSADAPAPPDRAVGGW